MSSRKGPGGPGKARRRPTETGTGLNKSKRDSLRLKKTKWDDNRKKEKGVERDESGTSLKWNVDPKKREKRLGGDWRRLEEDWRRLEED